MLYTSRNCVSSWYLVYILYTIWIGDERAQELLLEMFTGILHLYGEALYSSEKIYVFYWIVCDHKIACSDCYVMQFETMGLYCIASHVRFWKVYGEIHASPSTIFLMYMETQHLCTQYWKRLRVVRRCSISVNIQQLT